MTDFRREAYDKYVSTFKGAESNVDAAWLSSYGQWCKHKYLRFYSALAKDAPILDLGCGAGPFMEVLRAEGYTNIYGIDISAEQVEIAKARGLQAEVADAFAYLEGNAGRFAAISALDFYEHFTRDELFRLTRALYAALKPGGILLLQMPNGAGLFPRQIIHDDITHMTILSPVSLTQLLKIGGFGTIEIIESGPAPTSLKGRVRLAIWAAIKLGANLVRYVESTKTQQIWTENMICACQKPL
jgi:2-polyprenyl-3-methyl-5-hydroxy-6-metoxy-1,4-benzoquinol methylase